MINFHKTDDGKKFFNQTMPNLVAAVEGLTRAIKDSFPTKDKKECENCGTIVFEEQLIGMAARAENGDEITKYVCHNCFSNLNKGRHDEKEP